MDPTAQNQGIGFPGLPTTAQQFSSMSPYMLPNTYEKLRAAMMQQPPIGAPPMMMNSEFGAAGAMGFG